MLLDRKRACKFCILHKTMRPDFHKQGRNSVKLSALAVSQLVKMLN